MKKFLSAMMACAMVASMSATAFAAQPDIGLAGSSSGSATPTMTSTDAAFKSYSDADGDDNTVKVDGGKAYYPVQAMVGPYGYYADDKVLFDSKSKTISGNSDIYYAPIEYGDTAYYALIQYIPKANSSDSDAEASNGTIKADESKYDGLKINDSTFESDGWYTVVTESETVSSIKIKQDWEEGGSLVKSVSIVKKKVCNKTADADFDVSFEYSGDDSDETDRPYPTLESLGLKQFGLEENNYAYFLAIKYDDSTSVNDTDVIGTITLSKSKDPSIDKLEFDIEVNVDWENSWRPTSANSTDWEVTEDIELKADKNYALKFNCDDVITMEFDDDSYFEVDVSGQSKILFSYSTDYISKIAAKYPFAELNFWNGNGAKFNRVGEFFLSCEDLVGTQFLYQVTSDGKLAEVPGAEWDDSDEGFYFNTRVLGSYVVSDMELDIVEETTSSSSSSSSSSSESTTIVTPAAPVISNPSTGAIA